MTFGFLGIGALYEDTLLSLPHYPQEDHKLRATALQTRVGGNIPNTLHVLSQACSREDRLVFLSAFAQKAASKRLTDTLEEKSVEIAGVWRDCPDNPRSWILRSEHSGSRTIVNYNDVKELNSQELVDSVASLENTESITWIHFEGRIPDVLRAAIPSIRKLIPHATISIEFEKPDRPGLNDLLPLADIAFFSHTYYSHSQQSSPASFFASIPTRNSSTALILTVGKEGAYYFSKMYGEGHVNAPSVDVVDATGAGDTFSGGFIWSFGKMRRGLEESVAVGVNLASKKVSQEGFDGVWTT